MSQVRVHTHLHHWEEKQKEREEAAGAPLPQEATESAFWACQEKATHLSLETKGDKDEDGRDRSEQLWWRMG